MTSVDCNSEVCSGKLADAVLSRLCVKWHELYSANKDTSSASRDADEIALTCVLFASENIKYLSKISEFIILRNIELCKKSMIPWAEVVAWRLVLDRTNPDIEDTQGYETLVNELNHHKSDVRIWFMELVWMSKSRLSEENLTQPLLDNISGTLAGVSQAYGLLGEILSSEEVFEEVLNRYVPVDSFGEQYYERIEYFNEVGLLCCQSVYWSTESRCRRIITQTIFEVVSGKEMLNHY